MPPAFIPSVEDLSDRGTDGIFHIYMSCLSVSTYNQQGQCTNVGASYPYNYSVQEALYLVVIAIMSDSNVDNTIII